MALATRALALDGKAGDGNEPDPAAVLKIAQRTIREGAAREGKVAADIGPEDARGLLEAWLRSMGMQMRGARAARPTCSPRASPTPISTAAPAASTSGACAARSATAPGTSPGARSRRP